MRNLGHRANQQGRSAMIELLEGLRIGVIYGKESYCTAASPGNLSDPAKDYVDHVSRLPRQQAADTHA
jgi:hypothetical protein